MRHLLLLLFAALVALSPARAAEERDLDLTAFDQAMQLYAKRYCTKPPAGSGPFWHVNVSVEALADENGVVRASGVGRKECVWHKRGARAPQVRWPHTLVVAVPEGDRRPVPLIAFDEGVRSNLRQDPCTDDKRPKGFGEFKGVKFRLQAVVGDDGVLRANALWDSWCAWHPLVTGAL